MQDDSARAPAAPPPLLWRFLRPVARPDATFAYDRAARLNLLTDQAVPAVRGGVDVKSVPILRGED